MANIKTLAKREEERLRFGWGHALCAGCGIPIVVRTVLNSIKEPVVVANATGCLEVATTLFPYTAWNVPWVHNAFENAAATISGVETAYRVLKRRGKIDKEIRFVAFGGDGGTYDIGLQALSGALERGHRFLYVCYDNEAYMNTGIQRSSATPLGAFATTEPPGEMSFGKHRHRKDLTQIVIGHHIPYVAQASISHWQDLSRKVERAIEKDGPSFINVMSTCFRGWRFEAKLTTEIARLAVEAKFWPLYEVDEGEWRLNYLPEEPIAVRDWLKLQGRFAHLFRPEEKKEVIAAIQAEVDRQWEELLARCKVVPSA
ncbi:MAG: thiamine pyrophosphate-dependent enzyme [Candidatus Bipolaricaulia bacterium]